MALNSKFELEEDITPEEEALIKEAEQAQANWAAGGAVAGTAAGGLASALIPGAQPFAPVIMPAASAIGGWLGGQLGGNQAEAANKKFEEMREERLRELNKKNERINRTSELLGSWIRTPGL